MSDRRLTAANDRVVARALAAQFPELTPVDPVASFVCAPVVDLLGRPDGGRERQLRYGDAFELLETRDGMGFGLAPGAGYAGWVASEALRPASARATPTHRVAVRQTHAYPAPNFKAHETCALSHLSSLVVTGRDGRFCETELGWVPAMHLTETKATDPVAEAARYLGTPYLWGGNSGFGIDCSGLVQAGLSACGIACPGDSDLQEKALGETLAPGSAPRRGDLLFWTGHVAWVADPETILHANAHHMAVAYEGLSEAVARIEAQGDGPVTRHARLG